MFDVVITLDPTCFEYIDNNFNDKEIKNEEMLLSSSINRAISIKNQNFKTLSSLLLNSSNIVNLHYADLKIFVNYFENLSVTDNNKVFRYLPLKRQPILFIISNPMNSFCEFAQSLPIELNKQIEMAIELAQDSKRIDDFGNPSCTTNRLIVVFKDQDSADRFYYDYSGRNYYSTCEHLYCCFIDNLTFECSLFNSNRNIYYGSEKFELPTCPLCLECIESTVTKINTIHLEYQNKSWQFYRENCKICQITAKENQELSLYCCLECEVQNNLWCCIICGFIGCDRYNNGHMLSHYEATGHRFSMILLENKRIWDYEEDRYVHKVFQHDLQGTTTGVASASVTDIKGGEFNFRISNIISEYDTIMEDQLENQRLHYMREIERMNQLNDQFIAHQIQKITELKLRNQEMKKAIASKELLTKEFNKKAAALLKKAQENEENVILTANLREGLDQEIAKLEQQSKGNESSISELDTVKEKIESKQKYKSELEAELNSLYSKL